MLSLLLCFGVVGAAVVDHGQNFISSGMAPDELATGTEPAQNTYVVTHKGVSDADKVKIVNLHNSYRKQIGKNASNMMKVIWDDNIAVAAQKHAESCWYNHDDLSHRWTQSLPGVYIGQSMCAGKSDWTDCVGAWYSEKDNYAYGSGTKTLSWKDVGHYSQLATWHASRVGCGYAECEGRKDKTSFVCNYAYGQYYRDIIRPYKNGTACGDCPGQCDNGLCDCGGKICNNFGDLDLNTCTCSCLPFYTGDLCEHAVCGVAEHSSCVHHSKEECTRGVNIAALCPRHCGRC